MGTPVLLERLLTFSSRPRAYASGCGLLVPGLYFNSAVVISLADLNQLSQSMRDAD